jgi:hypothetical protein
VTAIIRVFLGVEREGTAGAKVKKDTNEETRERERERERVLKVSNISNNEWRKLWSSAEIWRGV